jgi:hypothetical protein
MTVDAPATPTTPGPDHRRLDVFIGRWHAQRRPQLTAALRSDRAAYVVSGFSRTVTALAGP